ncbi:MAG: tRNA epoxyqueuosine(34) reductase QueG [Rikenellaceae bacterium]|nr:tRNA epoxyqueuosine(34) reductase QueG [Rikenellaceae bacterium]MCL2692991.1 tRNA epoxyqueuosine(34) reductase QueG [Rikenellaceae bacterium]
MLISSDFIREAAREAGFDLCGVARARVLTERAETLDRWITDGAESGLMQYMRLNRDRRLDPAMLVEGAKTVVVCAVNYKNRAWQQEGSAKVASYAYATDYHHTIQQMLGSVLELIAARYPDTKGRCFCDTAPILEKAWAVEAGLGWVGKNSLLITPQYGSFVMLGEIVIDAECDGYDEPFVGDGCGDCRTCIDACPNNAISVQRTINASRCISRLTNERLPEGTAQPSPDMLNGWLAGCDECQSCCPHNRATPFFTNPAFTPVIDHADTTPDFWRALTEEDFQIIFGRTPLSRIGLKALKSRL